VLARVERAIWLLSYQLSCTGRRGLGENKKKQPPHTEEIPVIYTRQNPSVFTYSDKTRSAI